MVEQTSLLSLMNGIFRVQIGGVALRSPALHPASPHCTTGVALQLVSGSSGPHPKGLLLLPLLL